MEVEQRGLCQQVKNNRGGQDKLRMIDGVRLRSQRDIKASANPAHRTEEADSATYEEYLPNVSVAVWLHAEQKP